MVFLPAEFSQKGNPLNFNEVAPGKMHEVLGKLLTTDQYQRVLSAAMLQRRSLFAIAISLPLVSMADYESAVAAAGELETGADVLLRKQVLTLNQYVDALEEYGLEMESRGIAREKWEGEREILTSAKLLREDQIESMMVTLSLRGALAHVAVPSRSFIRFVRLGALALYHHAAFYGRRPVLHVYYSRRFKPMRRWVSRIRRNS